MKKHNHQEKILQLKMNHAVNKILPMITKSKNLTPFLQSRENSTDSLTNVFQLPSIQNIEPSLENENKFL